MKAYGVAKVQVPSFLTPAIGGVISFMPQLLYPSEMGPKSL